MKYSVARIIFLLFLFPAFFVSCSIPEGTPPELYWPIPPLKPRIKFLDYIIGSIDATGSRSGKFSRVLFGEEGEQGFLKPTFVAARDGVMYVSDLNRVQVYDFENKEFHLVGTKVLLNATGIAVASDGTLFVGDSSRLAVFIFKRGVVDVKKVGGPLMFSSVGGIALDEARGRFLVVDAKRHRVNIFSLDGEYLSTLGSRGTGPGKFNYPYDVAVGPDGKIYVADSGNFRVQIFDSQGEFLNAFGQVGAVPGMFARPKGISLDSEGHIYVVDALFGNFQIFDAEGRVYLIVGKNGSEPGMFLLPVGIHIDDNDKIYIVDQANRRVQIFQYIKYPAEDEQVPVS